MSSDRWLWFIFLALLLQTVDANRALPKPIVGIICFVVAVILFFICCYPICRYRRRLYNQPSGVVYQQPSGVNVINQTAPLHYPTQSYSGTYPITNVQQPVYPAYSAATTQPYPPYPAMGSATHQTQPPYPPAGSVIQPPYPPVVSTDQPPYPSAPEMSPNVPPPPYSSLFPERKQ